MAGTKTAFAFICLPPTKLSPYGECHERLEDEDKEEEEEEKFFKETVTSDVCFTSKMVYLSVIMLKTAICFINTLRMGSFKLFKRPLPGFFLNFNPLNAELNPICYLLALLAHHFLHVSRIRVKSLTLRLLMSYIYIYIYIWSTHS